MLTAHVALVRQTNRITLDALMRASAALQKQVVRDFGPLWGVSATVDAFARLKDVPLGYWAVMIRDDIGFQGAAGIHLDKSGQPYALVQHSSDWVLTASHEILEMLADPFGNRLVAGRSVKPGQGRVEYLVEVCDPSEAAEFGYTINGLLVSDFYTPAFFDPVQNSGTRYSYTGAINKPRQVLRGGYLSWHDPVTDHWFQSTWFSGSKPKFEDLGVLTGQGSLRSQIDALTPTDVTVPPEKPPAKRRSLVLEATGLAAPSSADEEPFEEASAARASMLESEIKQLKQNFGK